MATPPRKAPAAKKAGTRKIAAPAGVQIETLLNNASVKITRTTHAAWRRNRAAGARVRLCDSSAITEFSLVRRFTRHGKVTREVAVSGTPGKLLFRPRYQVRRGILAGQRRPNSSRILDKIILKRAKEVCPASQGRIAARPGASSRANLKPRPGALPLDPRHRGSPLGLRPFECGVGGRGSRQGCSCRRDGHVAALAVTPHTLPHHTQWKGSRGQSPWWGSREALAGFRAKLPGLASVRSGWAPTVVWGADRGRTK